MTLIVVKVKSEVKSEKKKRNVKSVQHDKTFSWNQPGLLGLTGTVLFVSQLPLKPCE